MSLLNDILKQIQGGVAQVNPFDGGQTYQSVTQPRQIQAQPIAQPMTARTTLPVVRSQQQIENAPFRMYEDNSFQGNPSSFSTQNPGYKFYEDNTFSAPSNQHSQMSDSWDINDPSALYPPTDPRSQQSWNPSGIETNSRGVNRMYQNPIVGATDPRLQVMRGNTMYSPGEGPRTNFNR